MARSSIRFARSSIALLLSAAALAACDRAGLESVLLSEASPAVLDGTPGMAMSNGTGAGAALPAAGASPGSGAPSAMQVSVARDISGAAGTDAFLSAGAFVQRQLIKGAEFAEVVRIDLEWRGLPVNLDPHRITVQKGGEYIEGLLVRDGELRFYTLNDPGHLVDVEFLIRLPDREVILPVKINSLPVKPEGEEDPATERELDAGAEAALDAAEAIEPEEVGHEEVEASDTPALEKRSRTPGLDVLVAQSLSLVAAPLYAGEGHGGALRDGGGALENGGGKEGGTEGSREGGIMRISTHGARGQAAAVSAPVQEPVSAGSMRKSGSGASLSAAEGAPSVSVKEGAPVEAAPSVEAVSSAKAASSVEAVPSVKAASSVEAVSSVKAAPSVGAGPSTAAEIPEKAAPSAAASSPVEGHALATASLSGAFIGEDGLGVTSLAGRRVSVSGPFNNVRIVATVDALGRFYVGHLPMGTYDVSLLDSHRPGFLTVLLKVREGSRHVSMTIPFEARARERSRRPSGRTFRTDWRRQQPVVEQDGREQGPEKGREQERGLGQEQEQEVETGTTVPAPVAAVE